ncbi:sugar ABC transporter substrate-binding protein [Actinoplanes sp. NPDC026623]|uniref:ABC transporter substrate-binding protein n=1 Tax=Actinoplanes sp. NPDC026623 TaxID=3155610 RepID=UPI0033C4BD76
MRTRISRGVRRAVAAAAALGLVAAMAACGSDDDAATGSTAVTAEGVDDGAELTLWTRAPLELQAKALVDAYNKSHKNQVKLTIVPNDDYVAKVGAAAGSGDLPDLFAADIVYVPNWTKAGLFSDITEHIGKLPYADKLNQGHIRAGTYKDAKYVLPFVLDLSVIFYNKALYKEAGLDPEKGPTTIDEFKQQALAIQKLKKPGVYGTYFGGNCGGCNVFTWFPMIWASGEEVMNPEGTKSLLDGPAAQKVYATWRELNAAGAIAPGAKDETGATWVAAFQEGKVGVMPYPATLLPTAAKTVDVGLVPIPGVTGGSSTFVGGDGIGISKDSKKNAQAWNFLSWLTTEAAQIDVLAAGNSTVSRTDLADNKYSAKDPRVATVNKVAASPQSKTPVALNFQQAFNAPTAPWSTLLRNQVYGDPGSLADDNAAITSVLGQGQ